MQTLFLIVLNPHTDDDKGEQGEKEEEEEEEKSATSIQQ